MTDKRIYQIGLTMINGVGDILARHLLESLGDEEAIFTEKKSQLYFFFCGFMRKRYSKRSGFLLGFFT